MYTGRTLIDKRDSFMETLEELQKILNDAPDGATHYDVDEDYCIEDSFCFSRGYWQPMGATVAMRSLADIHRIVDLMTFIGSVELESACVEMERNELLGKI